MSQKELNYVLKTIVSKLHIQEIYTFVVNLLIKTILNQNYLHMFYIIYFIPHLIWLLFSFWTGPISLPVKTLLLDGDSDTWNAILENI